MHDLIPDTFIQHLNQVDIVSATILPMKLTNLIIVMKKIQTALAAATAASADLADAGRGDLHLVDLVLGERLAAVCGAVEFTAVE